MDQYRTPLWDLKLSFTLQQLINCYLCWKKDLRFFWSCLNVWHTIPSSLFYKDINEKVEALVKRFEEDLSVSPSDLCIEYDLFRNVLKTIGLNSELASPRNTYQFLLCNDMNESCPNIATFYKIFLTIPVSSASSERSFSHLKWIKSYHRCTMGQERLSQLSLINIEYTIAQSINYDNVLNTFASMRKRKLAL